jgi:putative ABC transport system ATP-binding protein
MVTHDPRMAAYANRIIFLKDGAIVDDTKLDDSSNAQYVMDRLEAVAER